jgi:hypothetical protein
MPFEFTVDSEGSDTESCQAIGSSETYPTKARCIDIYAHLMQVALNKCDFDEQAVLTSPAFDPNDERRMLDVYICLSMSASSNKQRRLPLLVFLFETMGVSISKTNPTTHTSLFTLCCCSDADNVEYLISVLRRENTCELRTQAILTETLLAKWRESFDANIRLIDVLLRNVNDKNSLYERLTNVNNGQLLAPSQADLLAPISDNDYQDYRPMPYLDKQRLMLKYELVPTSQHRLAHVTALVVKWMHVCGSSTSSYVSPLTIRRYLTASELIEHVIRYLAALIQSDRIHVSHVEGYRHGWLNKENALCDADSRTVSFLQALEQRLDALCIAIRQREHRMASSPISLKRLCRLRVRSMMHYTASSRILIDHLPHGLFHFIANIG